MTNDAPKPSKTGYRKISFDCEPQLRVHFNTVVASLDITVAEAMMEAMKLWCESKGSTFNPLPPASQADPLE